VWSFELGGRLRDQGKIDAVVQAADIFTAVPLPVDFKNGAEEEFGRKFFDCEPNGVRRPRETSLTKSLVR
jgi:hypothetical protein